MSDDLDLRGIDQRHEPNPQFRAALRDRVVAIVDGADPDVVTETRDRVTVDLEPTSAPSAPRRNRRLVAQVMLAAAAVVVIALAASRDDGRTPADEPSPSVTSAPTVAPQSLLGASPHPEMLMPGTYFADGLAPFTTERIVVTVGAGWTYDIYNRSSSLNLWKTGGVSNGNQAGFIGFSRPGDLYRDACHPSLGFQRGDVDMTTVGGLVSALTAQEGWVDVTAPSDISVLGYGGRAFQRTAPTDMSDCDNTRGPRRDGTVGEHPLFRSWEGTLYEPGQTETVWVLDIDGTVVLINTTAYPETSKAETAELVAALDSIRLASSPEDATPADQPSPTVTVPPTTPPRALLTAPTDPELLTPGTYFVDEVAGTPMPRIFVTIGTGWTQGDGSGLSKGSRPGMHPEGDVGFITFSRPDKVYLDACHLSDGFNPGPVTNLDGLVTALTDQHGWADVTAPSDISIDGYPGKTFQRTVPAVLLNCPNFSPGHMRLPELDGNGLRSWLNESEGSLTGWYYEPGQVETLMVLDIDGTVVVINANLWTGSSAADRAEFTDVLDSIRIDRP